MPPMTAPTTFGAWLKHRRQHLHLTQAALAALAHCAVITLKKVEAGERRPSAELAAALGPALRLPPHLQPTFMRVARGELNVERLPAPTVPAAPASARPPLPSPLTALIGREPEASVLATMLTNPECRLLTLTGAGGMGKTRLAVHMAHTLVGQFAQGAVFVPLAGVAEPGAAGAHLAAALAEAWGLALDAGPVLAYVRAQHALVVLDNLEHLLAHPATRAWVTALAQAAPRLTLLITSREPLGVPGEWVFTLRGLPEGASAQKLFVERARQARADFAPTPADAPHIAAIVRQVHGWPLALELAAAWVRTLTCAEIAAEMARSVDFLAAPGHAEARHHSLRAVFTATWHALPPAEQTVLARLTVFRGGFTRAAAAQVAGASVHTLAALVEKSLVQRDETGRFALHELVRQLAAEQLAAPQAITAAHTAHFLALCQAQAAALRGPHQLEAARALAVELDNVRAALTPNTQLDATTAHALWAFCELRGAFTEGAEWFGRVAATLATRAYAGWFAMRLARFASAHAAYAEALALAVDPAERVPALLFTAIAHHVAGQAAQAAQFFAQAHHLAATLDDVWWQLQTRVHWHGAVAHHWEDFTAALAQLHALGDQRAYFGALIFYGLPWAFARGEPHAWAESTRAALMFFEQAGDRWGVGVAYLNLGRLAHAAADWPAARAAFAQSLHDLEALGAWADVAFAHLHWGYAEQAAGAPAEASAHWKQAATLAQQVHAHPTLQAAQAALQSGAVG